MKARRRSTPWPALSALLTGFLVAVWLIPDVEAATPVTASLTVAPSPTAKRGDVLMFQADVFSTPAFLAEYDMTPGTLMRIWVTRSDFGWVSDKLDIQYPGLGSVHVVFANGFTIPADAAGGQTYDFYLTYGIWWPLSDKASVTVKRVLNREVIRKIKGVKVAPGAPARQ